jgi:hypothetical protein
MTTRGHVADSVGGLAQRAVNRVVVRHQSDPFTLVDGSGREREYLVVEDEFAGAVGTGQSPNGGVWFYEVTGDLERNPSSKPGRWMSGAEAQAYFAERRVALPTTYSLRCVLRE